MDDHETAWLDRDTPRWCGDGATRAVPPEETLRRLTPHLAGLGITRVANVTGLDRVGIPVTMVVRPNGRGLAVSQGKGVTPAAAKVSGIMESLEAHHAEYTRCATRLESYAELRRTADVLDPDALPRMRASTFAPAACVPWVRGVDLARRAPAWVPYELVHASAARPRVPGSGAFLCTTNGLASGNTLAEAVLHGLCEVVERDCLALWEHAPAGARDATRVDLGTVTDPTCRVLLDRYAAADVAVVAWDVRSDVGLPAYRVQAFDRDAGALGRDYPASFGASAHPAAAVALARALTEAAQTRLTHIAGSRDDFTRQRYRATHDAGTLARLRALAADGGGARFDPARSCATDSAEGDVRAVVARLAAVGLTRVVVVDLSRPELPVHVTRTVVPGLEGVTESRHYAPGRRAKEHCA